MSKVAIYARQPAQIPESVVGQLRACHEYAAREGWEIVGTIIEGAVSGSALDRPGLKTLLADLRTGNFDVLLTERLDRLSRDHADTATLHQMARNAGVRLVTVENGEIDKLPAVRITMPGTVRRVVDKDAVCIARRIFAEAAAGVTPAEIAKRLRAEGVSLTLNRR